MSLNSRVEEVRDQNLRTKEIELFFRVLIAMEWWTILWMIIERVVSVVFVSVWCRRNERLCTGREMLAILNSRWKEIFRAISKFYKFVRIKVSI